MTEVADPPAPAGTTPDPDNPRSQAEREQTAGFDRDPSGTSPAGPSPDASDPAAGSSLADHQADQQQEDEEPEPEKLAKVGDGDKLSSKIAGGRPTDSELSIKSIRRPVQGQVDDKDEDAIYAFIVFGRAEETKLVRRRDGDGKVVKRTRVSTIAPQSYAIVDPEAARKLIEGDDGEDDSAPA